MAKQTNAKKSDQKPSKKLPHAKQEKPPKDIKVKHAPPVSSKDIIAKAEASVRVICGLLHFLAHEFIDCQARQIEAGSKGCCKETRFRIILFGGFLQFGVRFRVSALKRYYPQNQGQWKGYITCPFHAPCVFTAPLSSLSLTRKLLQQKLLFRRRIKRS